MTALRSLGLLAGFLALTALGAERAAPGKVKPPPKRGKAPDLKTDLNDLHLELMALQTLYHLQATPEQLKALARLAPKTAGAMPPRTDVEVSAKYRKAMVDLRAALLAENHEKVGELYETLDKLAEKEEPEFDEVELTDEARKRAPGFVRTLSARQVAGYVAGFADDFPDPAERLLEGLAQSRKLRGKEWQGLRDDLADQVGWLVAGLDPAAERKVSTRASALLNRAHRLGEKEFAKEKPALEKEARALAAAAGPTEVIRHFTERALAELLSNPFLAKAVAARRGKK
jgi:hypothetical protein